MPEENQNVEEIKCDICETKPCICCPNCGRHKCVCEQYFVNFDDDGNIIGFYVDSIHGDNIPKTAIPISTEDWQMYSANAGKYKLDGNIIREKTQQELDAEIANLPPRQPTPMELLQEADLDNKEAIATLYEMMLGVQSNES